MLTDATLSPVATLVELSIGDADRRHPNLAEMVGPGNLWCIGMSHILAAQCLGDGSIRVGISLPADDRHLDTYRSGRALLDVFDGWDRRLTALIEAADGPPTPRRIEAMPTGTRWAHRPGVTLIGDAAHLMPPVGEGANQAMLDAAELAGNRAVHPIAEMSARVQAMMLSPSAAEEIVRFFTSRPIEPAPAD